MTEAKPNQFFDIHKFPKDWGMIVFPISMSRAGNAQSAQACFDTLDSFMSKVSLNSVGAHFIYSDGLYMNFEKDAFETKNKFATTAVAHMRGLMKLVEKNSDKIQIDSAFSFESWFQMYLSHKSFFNVLKTVRDLYDSDPLFQKYVSEDAQEHGKELDERQLAFYLEEHTFDYLLINRQLQLRNDFVLGREQWVLGVYPGKPARGAIYLLQQDPLKINADSNPYKGQYDLEARKFIDYTKVDLESYNY